APGEAVVQVALCELARDLEVLHRREQVIAELGDRDGVLLTAGARLAQRIERRAQEARHRDPRDRVRVLEREEETELCSLVGAQLGDLATVEQSLALG